MGGTSRDAATVLVVEDDEALRLLCRVNLELEGYRVAEASTLQAARDALARERPAAVLLDVHVGGESGLDLLAEIRREHPATGVAIVTGDSDVALAAAAGADTVLPKPFTLEQLTGTVGRLAASEP